MSPRFQIELEKVAYSPGEVIKGWVLVTEGGGSRGLEAVLEYREEVEDYLEVPISISSGTLHAGDLTTGESFEFELSLPRDALPNCRSAHGELYWELDVLSEEAGRDTHERRRIEVRPGEARSDGLQEPTFAESDRAGRIDSTQSAARRIRGRGADIVRWVPFVFLAVGVVTLAVGAIWTVRTMQFVSGAEQATGTVVAVSEETDSDGNPLFAPVVSFATDDGEQIQFEADATSESRSIGDRVEVLYDPDEPSDAELNSFLDLWFAPLLTLAFGVVFVTVPLVVLLVRWS